MAETFHANVWVKGSGVVHLVRHGQTPLNAAGRFRGRADPPLDREGRHEARRAADELAMATIEAVYASPLRRAMQTAQIIADACGALIIELPDLVDLDYGTWEGLTAEEASRLDPVLFGRFLTSPRGVRLPGGEAVHDVERRVVKALRDLGDRHPGSSAAAVSHELPIRMVIARASAPVDQDIWAITVPTGSITTVSVTQGELTLVSPPRAPRRTEA